MSVFRSLLTAILLVAPAAASAQVGHDPRTSPYRDLKHGALLVPEAAIFQGSGGRLGVAPNSGVLRGFRAEIGGRGSITFGFEFATGTLERLIVDADDPVATRVKGPVDQTYSQFGITFLLNLTGGKTWHNLAPYVGGGLGVSSASRVPADTSGWNYGRRVYLAPTIGARYFLTRSIFLRAEARRQFVSVRYPDSYRQEPALDPGTATTSNAVLAGQRVKQWIGAGVYTFGVGIPFPWP